LNLRDINIKFSTEDECLAYIEAMKWPDGVVRCPTCGATSVTRYERPKTERKPRNPQKPPRNPGKLNRRQWFYICRNADCRQQFSPTSGTLFADTHLPLIVWFHAIGLLLNARKGISAKQLQRDLGIGGYKTAWYLLHRIRESMADVNPEPSGGTVEIDETYVRGRVHDKGQRVAPQKKKVVMGAVQRGGELRLRHVANQEAHTSRGFVSAHQP